MNTPEHQPETEIKEGAIAPAVQEVLQRSREISYKDHGETKVISVTHEGKTYAFSKEFRTWEMLISDGDGEQNMQVTEKSDIDLLNQLSEQDLTAEMRLALRNSRQVSYEKNGERKVVSVMLNGKRYKFHYDRTERSPWWMQMEDEEGEWLGMVNLKEDADATYLETLFQQDLSDGLREALSREAVILRNDDEVISVTYQSKMYNFRRDGGWMMDILDEGGHLLNSTPLREESDQTLLDKVAEMQNDTDEIERLRNGLKSEK